MEITPRYDGPPIIRLDGDPTAIAAPLRRQRARLEATLADLTDEQWRTPSRCDGWTAQDVVTHLTTTNQFWSFSIGSGLRGEPSRFLTGFDPKATPASMVDANAARHPRRRSRRSPRATSRSSTWRPVSTPAHGRRSREAPPGHISVSARAHHALWDGWVHGRATSSRPFRLAPPEEDDEDPRVAALRRHARAGFCDHQRRRPGRRARARPHPPHGHDRRHRGRRVRPRDRRRPARGRARPRGTAVDLLEVLSIHAPFTHDVPSESAWLVSGLSDVFESIA